MTDKKPLVSIVIPTYKRPELLRRALKSALNQTYPNVEVIVINDSPKSNLESMKKEFQSVSFYENSENMGGCYTRNRGIEESDGEYVNFLDDDDEIFPNKISLQIKKFRDSRVENLGIVTAHVEDNRSGKKIIKTNRVRGNRYRKLLSGYAISGIETMLIKKKCLIDVGGFDENLQSSQEYDLMIRLAERYQMDYVDEILSRENRSTDQISLNFDKKISGAKYLFSKYDQKYRSLGLLFWLRMQLKLKILLARYYVGKVFGESAYRFLGVR